MLSSSFPTLLLHFTDGGFKKSRPPCRFTIAMIRFFLFLSSYIKTSAFQRNAQPSPQVMISGVWGYVTNKHFGRNTGNGFLPKYAILRKIALLASSFENLYLGLVNPIFTKDGDNVKVKVAVKFLDNQTKTTQVSQYELTLHKDGNWKSIM